MFGKKKGEVIEGRVKDPVCGMYVDPSNAYYTELGGKKYYFCRPGCKVAFKKAKISHVDSRPLKVRKAPRGDGGCCH